MAEGNISLGIQDWFAIQYPVPHETNGIQRSFEWLASTFVVCINDA